MKYNVHRDDMLGKQKFSCISEALLHYMLKETHTFRCGLYQSISSCYRCRLGRTRLNALALRASVPSAHAGSKQTSLKKKFDQERSRKIREVWEYPAAGVSIFNVIFPQCRRKWRFLTYFFTHQNLYYRSKAIQ